MRLHISGWCGHIATTDRATAVSSHRGVCTIVCSLDEFLNVQRHSRFGIISMVGRVVWLAWLAWMAWIAGLAGWHGWHGWHGLQGWQGGMDGRACAICTYLVFVLEGGQVLSEQYSEHLDHFLAQLHALDGLLHLCAAHPCQHGLVLDGLGAEEHLSRHDIGGDVDLVALQELRAHKDNGIMVWVRSLQSMAVHALHAPHAVNGSPCAPCSQCHPHAVNGTHSDIHLRL
jgi:hypothetical protein